MKGTFSVAMCTYNGARYLRAQLESIGAQTRLPDELVICDDRSVDDSVRVVERFAASAPFPVRLEVNTSHLGSTKNFEKAIQRCAGTLIALADQDDVWLPRKLALIEAELQRQPNIGLVFSDAELVDDDLRPLGERLWTAIGFHGDAHRELKTGRRLDVLLPGWTVTGATMAFRSRFRALALPIPDNGPVIHDGWIAMIVAAVADVSIIDEPLILYRQHPQQQIGVPKTRASDRRAESMRQKVNRRNQYSESISGLERVRSRLAERSDQFECSAALRNLAARIAHLHTRENLPRSKLRRLPHVARELLTRRYHRYSNGLYSAVKDLLI